jgi:hypothetical protein
MKSGGTGVGDLALDPESTHHTEHIRNALHLNSREQLFSTLVPVWDKATEARVAIDFPFSLPHECFAASYSENPEDFNMQRVGPDEIPQQYETHPVTTEHGNLSFPIGFYSDGVPISK